MNGSGATGSFSTSSTVLGGSVFRPSSRLGVAPKGYHRLTVLGLCCTSARLALRDELWDFVIDNFLFLFAPPQMGHSIAYRVLDSRSVLDFLVIFRSPKNPAR